VARSDRARERIRNALKTCSSTLSLAETYEEESENDSTAIELLMRREEYPPPALPDGVVVLTCGVDVQEDRIELEVVGHGKR
jgi:phage terminase large subunit GpA-like protein